MSLAGRLSNALRVVAPVALFASLLGTATTAHAIVPYPDVHITSPGPTSSSAGTTAFQFSAAVNPSGSDTIASFQLVVDGSPYGGMLGCPTPGSRSCTGQLLWEAQAPSGTTATHDVQVEMHTTQNATALSTAVAVTVTHATATPVISSPVTGATVPGPDVFVDADSSFVAPRYGDQTLSMALLVDGGQVDFLTCDGSTTGADCPTELYWDASSAALGDHTLQVRLVTTSGGVWTSAVTHITLVGTPVPVVTVTSPTAGATVGGNIMVRATGTVDPAAGDYPRVMGLFVDGDLSGAIQNCSPTSSSCTLSFPWDTSALSGKHTIEVGLATVGQVEGFSSPLTVTVSNPPPTVVITSPTAGSSVSRVTTVIATGTIDPAQSDRVRDMQLIVDGVVRATAPCALGAGTLHSCSSAFSWDTLGLVGTHNLQVRFDTVRTTALSSVNSVVVAPLPTKIMIGRVAAVQRGATATIHGALVSTPDHKAIAGAPVQVTFTPVGGRPVTVPATTDGAGLFTAAYATPLRWNTLVSVTAGPEYGSSVGTAVIRVMTPVTCSVPAGAKHGKATTVVCASPLLPNGTTVTLRDLDKGTHVVATGKARSGKVRFTVVFPKKRQYRLTLWATTSSSKLYTATASKGYRIRVS